MNRKRILAIVILAILLFLSACSAGAGAGTAAAPAAPRPDEGISESGDLNLTQYSTASGAKGESQVYAGTDAKLVRHAEISIQTTDFPAAIDALDVLTDRLGGYYEQAQTQGGDYYDANARRYAMYTIRVPKEQFQVFLDTAGEIGHVVSSSESSADVGEEYHDTELRLKTLQTKQDRLLSLLEKAEVMEDIISLENSLSDVQYQIEQLTSTLNRYDSLVDYATIQLSVKEVIRLTDDSGQADSLVKRLGSAFADGFADFGRTTGDAAVWLAYHFIGLIILGAALAGLIVFGRKALRRRNEKKEPPAQS